LSNYLAALFPNDDWLRWEGDGKEDETAEKKKAILAFMKNKLRQQDFEGTVEKLLVDYVLMGNVFTDVDYVNESTLDEDGEEVRGYVGPLAVRVDPKDIVFNPLAPSYQKSPKITRSIYSLEELKYISTQHPEKWDYVASGIENREKISAHRGTYDQSDFAKAGALSSDGFGDLYEYYGDNYVEILEMVGDIVDPDTGELLENYVITIMDRREVIRKRPSKSWFKSMGKHHVGWRERPNNLYAMGPLDNLVGMQYQIDHYHNFKSDALDQTILPPLKIVGEVEDFSWGPGAKIHIDENGDVVPLRPEISGIIQADQAIALLEARMEEYAGAPKQAMGIRTPGEKTAFEVQSLDNAAGRTFQIKIAKFERLLEKLLNDMFAIAVKNMNADEVVRVVDEDLGVPEFLNITKEDVTARGKLRAVGAKHFAAQANLLQNLTGIGNSWIGSKIDPHISGVAMSKLVEEVLDLSKHDLVTTNIAILENQESQSLQNEAVRQIQEQEGVSLDGE
jgi:hypothetical protein